MNKCSSAIYCLQVSGGTVELQIFTNEPICQNKTGAKFQSWWYYRRLEWLDKIKLYLNALEKQFAII